MYNYYDNELNNVLGEDEYEEDDGTIAVDYDLQEDTPKMPLKKAQALADFTDSIDGELAEEQCATDLETDNASLTSLTTDLDAETAEQVDIDEKSAENAYNGGSNKKVEEKADSKKDGSELDADSENGLEKAEGENADKENEDKEKAESLNADNKSEGTGEENAENKNDENKNGEKEADANENKNAEQSGKSDIEKKRAAMQKRANEILAEDENGDNLKNGKSGEIPKLDNFDKAILGDVYKADGGENLAKLLAENGGKKMTNAVFGLGAAVTEGAVMKKHERVLVEDSPFLKDVLKVENDYSVPFAVQSIKAQVEEKPVIEEIKEEKEDKQVEPIIKEVIIKEPVQMECPMKCAISEALLSVKKFKTNVSVNSNEIICDVCGHVNKKGTEFCEKCSNYLVK